MKGTLALWYEPNPSESDFHPVKVELHLNLWRDLPSGVNFLDVGLFFRGSEGMSRFYLYIPAHLERSQVEDLSGILRSTANAVFNDVVRFGGEADGQYQISRSDRIDTVFSLHDGDLELVEDGDAVFGAGTRLTFRDTLVERMHRGEGRSYVRFRIHLNGRATNTFSSEVPARDQIFVSSAGLLEVTEFRLNERRSFPSSISNRRDMGHFEIERIHYFLIRDLEHQLISQHAPFEKVRRLEAPLWLKYLASAYPQGVDQLTASVAERLVIYHWKEPPPGKSIHDFIAFASFRTTSSHLALYAIMIVLFGAAGSILASITTTQLAFYIRTAGETGGPTADTLVKAEVWLFAALATFIVTVIFWPAIRLFVRGIWLALSSRILVARTKWALRKRIGKKLG